VGALLERIDELLGAPAPEDGSEHHTASRIANTLTEGYAHALALEAKRWRLHRQLGEAAAELQRGDSQGAEEVSSLARRVAEADDELARLRERLRALRRRASDLRLLPARSN
jgi:chromosome segregation ATPase